MAPSPRNRLSAACLLAVLLAGCTTAPTSTNVKGVGGNAVDIVTTAAADVIGGPLIPNANVALGPSVSYPAESLVYWGIWVGAAYLILDPLAPNWEIQEARFPENHVHLALTMKRYYAGGAGEARVIFHRRAKELMRAGGYAGYEVVEYAEGMESSVLGSQRNATGVVRFNKSRG
jgi:hypothetical protein